MEDAGYLLVMYSMFIPVLTWALYATFSTNQLQAGLISIGAAALATGVASISIPRDDVFVDILYTQFKVLGCLLVAMMVIRVIFVQYSKHRTKPGRKECPNTRGIT